MAPELLPAKNSDGLRVGLVVARLNQFITQPLLNGALAELTRQGLDDTHVDHLWVAGAAEIPTALQALARTGRYHGLVALGAVIRGGTPHFDYVCDLVTRGVSRVSLDSGLPVAFGVLTCDTVEQALERAAVDKGNKGGEAAAAALELARLCRTLEAR